MFRQYMLESIVLKGLDFGLLNELKKTLGDNYLITKQDINLLIIFNARMSMKGNRETMQNIIRRVDTLDKDEMKILYEIHCDPYELFIDAGWIDKKCNILI